MTQQELPSALKNIVESSQTPDAIFSALLPAVGDFLQSDRCFLYLHNPQNNLVELPFVGFVLQMYLLFIMKNGQHNPQL